MSARVNPEPPARPSTTWVNAPPLAKQRDGRAARALIVSFWLWLGAALVATATAAVALLEFDRMHGVLYGIARQQDGATDPATLDNVATLAIAVFVGGGVAVALVQMLVAVPMRNGRNWARGVLVGLVFLTVVYALMLAESVTPEVLGELVPVVRGGLGIYILLAVTATVAMFGRRSGRKARCQS